MTLRPTRRSEYLSHLLAWILGIAAVVFFFLWKTGSIDSTLIAGSSISLGAIFVEFLVFQLESWHVNALSWELTADSIIEKGQRSFLSRVATIRLSDVESVRYNTFNWRLERGVSVRSKTGQKLFIPQQTDYYLEFIRRLQSVVK